MDLDTLKAKFNALSLRERYMVMGGTLLIVFFIVYLYIWSPLTSNVFSCLRAAYTLAASPAGPPPIIINSYMSVLPPQNNY